MQTDPGIHVCMHSVWPLNRHVNMCIWNTCDLLWALCPEHKLAQHTPLSIPAFLYESRAGVH